MIKNGEGRPVLCEMRLTRLSYEDGPHLLASFVDISERKEIEQKLIQNNQALQEIAFMQSHQVRAPIAIILGLISLLRFDDPNDPINREILIKLKPVTEAFDGLIYEIVKKVNEIESMNRGIGIKSHSVSRKWPD